MTDIKLLPCPFCGSDATIEQIGDRRKSTIYGCDGCGCRLETGEEWSHGRDWNQRASVVGNDELSKAITELRRIMTTAAAAGDVTWSSHSIADYTDSQTLQTIFDAVFHGDLAPKQVDNS